MFLSCQWYKFYYALIEKKLGIVAHVYNLSYLGGRDLKNLYSKLGHAKVSKNTSQK
jgi:hypothetical protein